MKTNRVVVTGLGVYSPFGSGTDILWDSMISGKSAVRNMKNDWYRQVEDLDSWLGAPYALPLDESAVPRKIRKTMGKTALLGYLSVLDALKASGLDNTALTSGKTGISFGSTIGSAQSLQDTFFEIFKTRNKREIPSSMFFKVMSHSVAANLAQAFNISGRVFSQLRLFVRTAGHRFRL